MDKPADVWAFQGLIEIQYISLGPGYVENSTPCASVQVGTVVMKYSMSPVPLLRLRCDLKASHQHIQPPSTLYTAPVTKDASSLNKNAITLATSTASALLFCTVCCKPRFTSSGSSPADMGVLTEPVNAWLVGLEPYVSSLKKET